LFPGFFQDTSAAM